MRSSLLKGNVLDLGMQCGVINETASNLPVERRRKGRVLCDG